VTQGSDPFALVLMDIQMPVMDGYEAARLIRREKSSETLPIIAITAYALPEDRQRCLEAGMNDHLAKPFEIEDLQEKLLRWLTPGAEWEEIMEETFCSGGETSTALPPALPEPAVLRVDETLDRLGGDSDFYLELLMEFVEENQDVAGQLESLLNDGEHDAALSIAHSLKGVAANLGAVELAATAAAMEAAIQRGKAEEAGAQVTMLNAEFSRVRVAVAAFASEHEPGNEAIP